MAAQCPQVMDLLPASCTTTGAPHSGQAMRWLSSSLRLAPPKPSMPSAASSTAWPRKGCGGLSWSSQLSTLPSSARASTTCIGRSDGALRISPSAEISSACRLAVTVWSWP